MTATHPPPTTSPFLKWKPAEVNETGSLKTDLHLPEDNMGILTAFGLFTYWLIESHVFLDFDVFSEESLVAFPVGKGILGKQSALLWEWTRLNNKLQFLLFDCIYFNLVQLILLLGRLILAPEVLLPRIEISL